MRAELLELAHRLARKGEPFVLATVVRREAPTSAQLGDQALITGSGEFHGWLGGACTKEVVLREARAAIFRGAPRLILLTADPDAAKVNGVRALPMTCHSGGGVEIYLDPQLPEERLVVFGESEVARAFERIAPEVGFRPESGDGSAVEGADAEKGGLGSDRPPWVVIATYGERDEEALERARDLDPAYVALVSGKKRFAAMRESLLESGFEAAFLDRISSPAGLDIGARTPGEIALSILAEMIRVRHERAGAAATEAPGSEDAAREASDAADTREAIDPVCGMTVPCETSPSAEYEGTTYWFCCDGCRRRFLKTPEMFAASWAG